MHFWRRKITAAVTCIALATIAAIGVGCTSGTNASDGIRALGTGRTPPRNTAPKPADGTDPTAPGPTTPRPTTPAGVGTTSIVGPGEPGDSERRLIAQGALDRYDRAVTALNADPSALLRPGDALVAELDAVVPAATVLASDVKAAVADRLSAGEQVRRPEDGTTSWVHHATAIVPPDPVTGSGEIAFDWCSWSPGVAVDATSGTVTDDGVGHATGTGTVALVGSTWTLTSLDQMSLEVLPAGSPDPCPGAQR